MNSENYHFSDEAIVTSILNGKIQDFAVVVKNTEKLVIQIVQKMTTDEDDQKDLVQDIYLRAYQKLPSFQFKCKLSTWIATIAYNTTVNYLQKKKIPIIEMAKTIEDIFENPELETVKTEAVEVLNAAIAKLPALYKTLITLYHIEELPNKEISEITNLPEGTIKSYLHRARKILKDNINLHYKNEPL